MSRQGKQQAGRANASSSGGGTGATPSNGPDVRSLASESLVESAFPGAAAQDFRIFVEPSVHRAMREHCRENAGVEVCGVLVGSWARDGIGPYVRVDASIRGESATSRFAEVTFTHETWSKINQRMDTEFADRRIVGWYHSHPDFGIFLSDRDRFIHEHFFNAPGQVALVIDPVRDEEGIFVWQEGRPQPAPLYWIGDVPRVSAGAAGQGANTTMRESAHGSSRDHSSDEATGADTLRLDDREHRREASRERFSLVTIFAALGLLLAGYWLGGFGDRMRDLRVAEGMARQLAARSQSFESTAAISRAATRVSNLFERLAEPPPPTGDAAKDAGKDAAAAADRIKLDEPGTRELLRRDLQLVHRELFTAMRALDLGPEEQLAIDTLLARRLAELQAAAKSAEAADGAKPAAPAPSAAPAPAGGGAR